LHQDGLIHDMKQPQRRFLILREFDRFDQAAIRGVASVYRYENSPVH
jgi:hypothetical protein